MAELTGVITEAGREAVGRGVEQNIGRTNGRGAQEDDLGVVINLLASLGIDDAHTGCAGGIGVVDEISDDGVGPQDKVARGIGSREGGAVGGKVRPVRTATDAAIARLAVGATIVRDGEVGDAANNATTIGERSGDFSGGMFFDAAQFQGREECAVGELRQAFAGAGDTSEFFDVVIPRGEVGVADGPIDAVAVLGVGLEVEIAPAIGLATPVEGATSHVIAPHPVEAFGSEEGLSMSSTNPCFEDGLVV